jgi:hypothetical protein
MAGKLRIVRHYEPMPEEDLVRVLSDVYSRLIDPETVRQLQEEKRAHIIGEENKITKVIEGV